MSMLGKLEWINHEKLAEFILNCQDMETGGIADRPGDISDVFHTFFGIAGLSLLNFDHLEPVDPVFALPKVTTSNLNLNVPYQSLPRSNT